MNRFIKFCFIFSTSIMVACSDYRTGYHDAINGIDKKKWLMLGEKEYSRGFHAGAAEKFQQDWMAENPIDPDRLVCITPKMRSDEEIFILNNYERLSNDIYQLIK